MVYSALLSFKSDLGALSSESYSTGSTSRSPLTKEQGEKSEWKTKVMEMAKLEGERKLKKIVFNLISYYGKLMQTVITIMWCMSEELAPCNNVASVN